jgi:mycothiol system anti-sigma-R factor
MSDHIIDQITAYLEGILPEDTRRNLEAHIDTCSDCQKALENARELTAMLEQTGPLYRAPKTLRARIEQMLRLRRLPPSPPCASE